MSEQRRLRAQFFRHRAMEGQAALVDESVIFHAAAKVADRWQGDKCAVISRPRVQTEGLDTPPMRGSCASREDGGIRHRADVPPRNEIAPAKMRSKSLNFGTRRQIRGDEVRAEEQEDHAGLVPLAVDLQAVRIEQ